MDLYPERHGGIYQIRNLANGCLYIGSAVDLRHRCAEHIRQLCEGKHHSKYLQRSWSTHGRSAFEFRPLLFCDRKDLLFYEQRALDVYRPEYNHAKVAGSMLGHKHSEETRRKLSAAHMGKPSGRKGKKSSPESVAKMRASRKGKGTGPRSAQWRANISAAVKGRVVTAEQRAKISETLTGHKQSPEQIEKRAQKLRGRKMPPGFAGAASRRMRGVNLNPAHCLSIGKSKAKLTDAQVREIRRRRTAGENQCSLAREYSIDQSAISELVRMKSYRWVE